MVSSRAVRAKDLSPQAPEQLQPMPGPAIGPAREQEEGVTAAVGKSEPEPGGLAEYHAATFKRDIGDFAPARKRRYPAGRINANPSNSPGALLNPPRATAAIYSPDRPEQQAQDAGDIDRRDQKQPGNAGHSARSRNQPRGQGICLKVYREYG